MSLTATGLVIISPSGEILFREVIKSKKLKDLDRLVFIRDQIISRLRDYQVKQVSVEGFSFGSRGRALFELGGIGYIIRLALYESKIDFIDVPPSVLKKFITGKGNADKQQVKESLENRHGIIFTDHNEADAFGLAQYYLLNHRK